MFKINKLGRFLSPKHAQQSSVEHELVVTCKTVKNSGINYDFDVTLPS